MIVFTETWLKDDILDSELTDRYTLYRCDRSTATSQYRRGGGVLIGVKSELKSTSVSLTGDDALEQTAVSIELMNSKIFVCSIYLPPNSNPVLYETHSACIQQLTSLTKDDDRIFVLGDYNLPNLCCIYDDDLHCYLPTNASSEPELTLVECMLLASLR